MTCTFHWQELSASTRRELDHQLAYYMSLPETTPEVSGGRKNDLYRVYAQTRVLHDIASGEWNPPQDLRALLFKPRPPLHVLHFKDEFAKCMMGSTCLVRPHSRKHDCEDVLDVLTASNHRLEHLYHMRRRWAHECLRGGPYRLLWNNACCYVLRPDSDLSKLVLPIHYSVFHPFYFPKDRATPSQMLEASRIIDSNDALFNTVIYAALIEGLTYLMRLTRFQEDPLSDDARPLFFKPSYAIMVDSSPSLGRSLFACVKTCKLKGLKKGEAIIHEGSGLAVACGVIRPSFEHGEHYGFDYFAQVSKGWSDPSNLLVTNEGRFDPAWPVGAGSPMFYANCSHHGNCYVYNVDARDKSKGVVKGSTNLYKLPILTAARDLFERDFVEGERVAAQNGFRPIKGVLRLPLEYLYSPKHVSRIKMEGYVRCRCLSYCAQGKGKEKWYVFVDPRPKTPSEASYDEHKIKKMPMHDAHKREICGWIRSKRRKV